MPGTALEAGTKGKTHLGRKAREMLKEIYLPFRLKKKKKRKEGRQGLHKKDKIQQSGSQQSCEAWIVIKFLLNSLEVSPAVMHLGESRRELRATAMSGGRG